MEKSSSDKSTLGHLLCTGGIGYVGSHTVLQLLKAGYDITVVDNLSNSKYEIVNALSNLAGKSFDFYNIDIRNFNSLKMLFFKNNFSGVIHFAGLKCINESVRNPLSYYDCNVTGTISLLKAMSESGCKSFVFSSSAAVYQAKSTHIVEEDPVEPSSPYGETKLIVEGILHNLWKADNSWKVSVLRYFNPIGCHESGCIGETAEEPCNLLPKIQEVAAGIQKCLTIYGHDWPTVDGTGVRDYIHVMDLADGHIAAYRQLVSEQNGSFKVYNIGTGRGTSVLELKRYFEEANNVTIPHVFGNRRLGDLASVVADPSKANRELNWKATRSIKDACRSAWLWQSNQEGYAERNVETLTISERNKK